MGKESIYKVRCPTCGNVQQVLVRGDIIGKKRNCVYCPAKINIKEQLIVRVK